MKTLKDILLAMLVTGVALIAGGAQTVTGSYYWLTGAGATTGTGNTGIIDPVKATVPDKGSATFTAKPPLGQKAVAWYKSIRTPLTVPSSFARLGTGNAYTWTNADGSSANVILGLELDYISYKLKYDGGGESTYRYTNNVTIANCTSTRAGYHFADAWTNSVGISFANGSTVTGSSFAIANRDDSAIVALYPKWVANVTELNLDHDGGTGGSSSVSATYDANLPEVTPPTKTGYTFNGYWTARNGSGKQYYDASGKGVMKWAEISVNTLYAAWQVNHYTITVSATGDGTVELSPTGGSYTNGQSVAMTAKSQTGSSFVKWSDGSTVNPRTLTITNSVTYTAYFSTLQYTVKWQDASTFGSVILKTETVNYGEDATEPDTPRHDGYTFNGWTESGSNIRANKTITAKYQANQYRVWLDANDGSASPARRSCLYTYDSPGTLPKNDYTRIGYTFQGWGTNRTDSVVVYADGAQVLNWRTEGTMDLYAVWKANDYMVRFAAGDGEGSMDNQPFVYDRSQALALNAFTHGDLGFLGWNGSDGKQYADGQVVSNLTAELNGIITLTARWAQTIHVAFDGNGATNMSAMAVQDFSGPDDEQNLTSNRFGKVGYVFGGWATNRADAVAGKITYADGAKVKMKASAGSTVTLYATWSPITYYVAFAPGTGVVSSDMPALMKRYDESFTLPDVTGHYSPANPALDTFDRWQDTVNGKRYANVMTVSNLCATAGATNTLIATWKLDVGEWSEHMHCTTLRWGIGNSVGSIEWTCNEGPAYGCTNTGMSVSQADGTLGQKTWLQASVKTNGTLRFACRRINGTSSASLCSLAIGLAVAPDGRDFNDTNYFEDDQGAYRWVDFENEEWVAVELQIPIADGQSETTIRLRNYTMGSGGYVEIDQVVWIPEGIDPGGDEPQPGKDEPTVTGITFENGKLVIRSTGDAKFGYQVLSAPSLEAPIEWTPLSSSYQEGLDVGQRFELTVDPAEPQMFYKVEVLKKR